MEIKFQDKLDNQETKQIEQALLLLDSRLKIQRLKIAEQESALKRAQHTRETIREQVIKLSVEFSDLLGADHHRLSSNKNAFMGNTIPILEKCVGQQIAKLKESDERVSHDKGKLQQDIHKASCLDLTNHELEKILRRAVRLNQSCKEQYEIEEITERPRSLESARFTEEAINRGIFSKESHLRDSSQTIVGDSTYPHKTFEPAENLHCAKLRSNSHSLLEVGDALVDEEDVYNQINHHEDRLLGLEMDSSKASLMQLKPGPSYSEVHLVKPSFEPVKETVAELPDREQAKINPSNIGEPLSLTMSFPVESRHRSEAHIGDENDGGPPRINWKESLLTISISEREGMAKIDLSADRALRENLSNARRYFESELKQLFRADIEINEIYRSI